MTKQLTPLEWLNYYKKKLQISGQTIRPNGFGVIEKTLKDNEWLNKELVKFEMAFTEENEEKLKLKEILGIIKEKEIDIWLLKVCDYDNYCRIRTKCLETNVESMVDCDKPAIPLPTQEEFDLLKEELL